jgi:hypothetical protein
MSVKASLNYSCYSTGKLTTLSLVDHVRRRSVSFSSPTMSGPNIQRCADMSCAPSVSLLKKCRSVFFLPQSNPPTGPLPPLPIPDGEEPNVLFADTSRSNSPALTIEDFIQNYQPPDLEL